MNTSRPISENSEIDSIPEDMIPEMDIIDCVGFGMMISPDISESFTDERISVLSGMVYIPFPDNT